MSQKSGTHVKHYFESSNLLCNRDQQSCTFVTRKEITAHLRRGDRLGVVVGGHVLSDDGLDLGSRRRRKGRRRGRDLEKNFSI